MKEVKVGDKVMDSQNYRVGKVLKLNKSKRKGYIKFRDKHRQGDSKNGKEWVNKSRLVVIGDVI